MGVPQQLQADGQAHPQREPVVDEHAFDLLFRTYFDPLSRFVQRYLRSREEAEDVVHDLFARLWERRGELGEIGDPGTYLYGAARNRALTRLRHRAVEGRWRERAELGQQADVTSAADDPERNLLSAEIRAAVQREVDTLPARQKDVLLRRWRGESYAGIAQTLDISISTVSQHMTRALDRLRGALAGYL